MKAFNVAQILSNSESAFEDQLSVLNVRITSYRQDLMTLKQEQLEIYPLMAKVLLLESPELKNVTEIDVLQKQMKGQIAELNRQLLELKQQQWERQRQNELSERIEPLEAEKVALLMRDPKFVELDSQLASLREQSQSISQLEQDIHLEAQEKGDEYRANEAFEYLMARRFGESDYRGKWIFRNMDSWLARQIDFPKNLRNYRTLLAMAQEVTNRREEIGPRLDDVSSRHEIMVNGAAKRVGLAPLLEQLTRLVSTIETRQGDIGRLHNLLRDSIVGESPLFVSIAEKMASVMQSLPLKQLDEMAKKTQSTQDDRLFARLRENVEQVSSLEHSLQAIQPQWEATNVQYERMRELSQHYAASGLNSAKYSYDIDQKQIVDLIKAIVLKQFGPRHLVEVLKSVRYVSEAGSSSSDNDWSWTSSSTSTKTSSSGTTRTSASTSTFSSRGSGSSSRGSSSSGSSSSSSSGSSFGGGSHRTSSSSGGGRFTTTDSF